MADSAGGPSAAATADEIRYWNLSRSLYRQLVERSTHSSLSDHDRVRVLNACEYVVARLTENPSSSAVLSRWLCREIRWSYSREDLPVMSSAIRQMLAIIAALLTKARREAGRSCAAQTRKGTPCQREARPGSEYCPSHGHLDDAGQELEVPAA